MAQSFLLRELATRVGGRVVGAADRRIRGVATLEAAGPDELSFFTNIRYRRAAAESRAGAILVGSGISVPGHDLLEAPEPYVALAQILEVFHPPRPRRRGIHPDARVARSAQVGDGVSVGPFAVVEAGCTLGDGCSVAAGCVLGEGASLGPHTILMPRVVVYPGTRIGARCLIHAGATLGADGFGFATSQDRHRKIPQVGRVVIEDDVEIGANSAIDRATLGETVVGAGTKIDDLVMIAHNVRLGPGCLLAAQSGIAGSSRVGAHVTFAGQAGAAGHLEIGDDCIVAAKSAVLQDLPAGSFVSGIPATDHRRWKRAQAVAAKLPELRSEMRALRERLAALERRLDDEED